MDQTEFEQIKEGSILHTSWGYDMTINDFALVLEHTGKSLLCQHIGTKEISGDSYGIGGASVMPDLDFKKGKPFRVRIFQKNGYIHLSGSYPFVVGNDGIEHKRPSFWWLHEENKTYYENHLD